MTKVQRAMPDKSGANTHRSARTAGWPDLAGRLIEDDGGKRHVLPVRVYFEDTDFSGFVYHGSYVRWFERGRSDFLRLLGADHHVLINPDGEGEAAAFVVRRLNLDYKRPARIDEVLEVTTWVHAVGAATLDLKQSIARDGEELCQADVLVVLISLSGKPMRLAKTLRESFAARKSD